MLGGDKEQREKFTYDSHHFRLKIVQWQDM
jgi:hypothetical protein